MTHHLYPFSDERSYFFGPLHDHNRLCHGSKTFFRKPDKDKRFFTVFVVKNTSFAAISCRKLSGGGVLTVQSLFHTMSSTVSSTLRIFSSVCPPEGSSACCSTGMGALGVSPRNTKSLRSGISRPSAGEF